MSQEQRKIAILSFDYLFIGRKSIYTRPEWEAGAKHGEPDDLKVLVAKYSMSLSVFAHPVERKGADDTGYIVECLVRDVRWLGYSRIIFEKRQ